jgi:hypothetical protein
MSLLPRQVARKEAAGYDASGGTTGSEIWGGLFTRRHAQIHLFGRSSTACLSITNSVQIESSLLSWLSSGSPGFLRGRFG